MSGKIQKWRNVTPSGKILHYCYRLRASNGKKKGYEIYQSRQGRNAAIRKLMRKDKNLKLETVKDTVAKKK